MTFAMPLMPQKSKMNWAGKPMKILKQELKKPLIGTLINTNRPDENQRT